MFSDPQKIVDQFRLDHGHVVADFGSGSGFYTLAAAKAVGSAGKVYALDVQRDLLLRLKTEANNRGLRNVEIITADLERPAGSLLRPETVHEVIIANLLFQVKNRDRVIEEAVRLLKKNGRLLIVDWRESFGNLGPTPAMIFGEDQARQLAENYHLQFMEGISAGEHHYGLIFKKQ